MEETYPTEITMLKRNAQIGSYIFVIDLISDFFEGERWEETIFDLKSKQRRVYSLSLSISLPLCCFPVMMKAE
ncbi:hypothetical protein L6452_15226 [Arctium lappa]|uniref:Uncharacterized protein n=1 Tax=Arctium lappa TaxID=4217 RepID=A0ACB9CNA2_ARCLA|nr:hypothetical protein L6452_15226 [Arctium lappa]